MHKPFSVIAAAALLSGCATMPGSEPVDAAFTAPIPTLVALLEAENGALSDSARAFERSVDLDGDGTSESLVYIRDPMLCGSGGCPLTILDWQDGEWVRQQVIGPAQLPITLIERRGRNTALGVTVYGGGMGKRVMALIPDDGVYPANPTVAPATEWGGDPGEVLIADGKGVPVR